MLPTITVDIGTTSIKLCMFDDNARLVTARRVHTPTVRDDHGEIYDQHALQNAVVAFIRDLDGAARSRVERIAIAGVGESGALVRPDCTLASPLILWHDQRGAALLASLDQRDRARIYQITGLPTSGNYALSKVAWVSKLLGSRVNGAQWLNVAEYIASTMTGQRWAEPSLASRTMALDVQQRSWSVEICDLFDVSVALFPPLRAAIDGVSLTPAFAAEVGLSGDVRVHVAGHDHMVGGVGAGLRQGELLNSTGTTEGLLFLQDEPSLDSRAEHSKLANGLACSGGGYTLFASIPTGGSAFATLQQLVGLTPEELTGRVNQLHARYMVGALDLQAVPLVLPQFRGSPPPTKDPSARGLIAGVRTDTTADDIIVGCFLGMALQFRDVLNLFETRIDLVKVTGSATANPLWQQLKVDLLGTPLVASRTPEVVSRGAQALASGQSCQWQDTDPYSVPADNARHARLAEWAAEIEPQWQYLKGFPS